MRLIWSSAVPEYLKSISPLENVFRFPFVPVPLSLTHFDGTLNKADKAQLLHTLENLVDGGPPDKFDTVDLRHVSSALFGVEHCINDHCVKFVWRPIVYHILQLVQQLSIVCYIKGSIQIGQGEWHWDQRESEEILQSICSKVLRYSRRPNKFHVPSYSFILYTIINPQSSHGTIAEEILQNNCSMARRVEFMCKNYQKYSKVIERNRRGAVESTFIITGPDQKRPRDWQQGLASTSFNTSLF